MPSAFILPILCCPHVEVLDKRNGLLFSEFTIVSQENVNVECCCIYGTGLGFF